MTRYLVHYETVIGTIATLHVESPDLAGIVERASLAAGWGPHEWRMLVAAWPDPLTNEEQAAGVSQ